LNIEYSQPVIFTNLFEVVKFTKSRAREIIISGFTVLLNYVYIYYITYTVCEGLPKPF